MARKSKVYRVVRKTQYGSPHQFMGTIDFLLERSQFGSILNTGYEYWLADKKRHKKINTNPTTINSLITNLINAEDNRAANGYSGVTYEVWEGENRIY